MGTYKEWVDFLRSRGHDVPYKLESHFDFTPEGAIASSQYYFNGRGYRLLRQVIEAQIKFYKIPPDEIPEQFK